MPSKKYSPLPHAPLAVLLLLALFLCTLSSCTSQGEKPADSFASSAASVSVSALSGGLDGIIFLGESTTYHLISRGVLRNKEKTTQVWAPKSGTLMLDRTTPFCRIVYPETKEEVDLATALDLKRPESILLTFGLNGAPLFIKRGEEYFKGCYRELIDSIRAASASTRIMLQACFPIAKSMDMSLYTINSATLNASIDTINVWTAELADELCLDFIDSSPPLKTSDGFLQEKYHVGDGHHLTRDAYIVIIEQIKNYMASHSAPGEVT